MMHKRWANQIKDTAEVDPQLLLANPFNFRTHPQFQQDALAGVLDELGWIQDVIVNQPSMTIIDGHLRVALALQTGQPTVPVSYVQLTPAQERLAIATFDPIGARAEADAQILDALLRDTSSTDSRVSALLADVYEHEGGKASSLVPTPTAQAEPERRSDHLIEIYCSDERLGEFQQTLDDWARLSDVQLNIA